MRDKVPVVTGNVGVTQASNSLADFALWLQKNDYWRPRIHHLQVQNPQMVYLYLSDQHSLISVQRVVLGSMRGYEAKLNKLRVFLEDGKEAQKDKQSREIDLRFKGQVVGRN